MATELGKMLKKSIDQVNARKAAGPVWKGPEEDGVTYSLLVRFLNCRERFRLLVVEGLKPDEGFNHRLEFGQMWHVCEEALAGHKPMKWELELTRYCQSLMAKHPVDRDKVNHWYQVCRLQFPIYVEHWAEQKDVKDRTPLLQEQVFDVPYRLPSGRAVRLRGKWDAVDLIGKGKVAGVYLQENKTKSEIDRQEIERQLTFDLQTMLYAVALAELQRALRTDTRPEDEWSKVLPEWRKLSGSIFNCPFRGVRYNVIRRPLSGGKGNIKRGKEKKLRRKGKVVGIKPAETAEHFYDRVRQYIVDDPKSYFDRWTVEVRLAEIERFRRECLDPMLEALCWWWDGQVGNQNDYAPPSFHWRHPFGVWNSINETGHSEYDAKLATGSEAGLKRVTNLFPELS